MTAKTFKELFRKAKERDEYWVADAILTYTEELSRLVEKKGVSQADLARALGVSTAYVTKVFRGNTNFTIQTMVKLARAAGGRVNIHISPERAIGRWVDVHSKPRLLGAGAMGSLLPLDVSELGSYSLSKRTLSPGDEDHDYAIAS